MKADQAVEDRYWLDVVETVVPYDNRLWKAVANRDERGGDNVPVTLTRRCPGCWGTAHGLAVLRRPHRERVTVMLGELKADIARHLARRETLTTAGIRTGWGEDGLFVVEL